jgi:hypothetical protein
MAGKQGNIGIIKGLVVVRLVEGTTRHDAIELARSTLGGELVSQNPTKRKYKIRVPVDTTDGLLKVILKARRDRRVKSANYDSVIEPYHGTGQ